MIIITISSHNLLEHMVVKETFGGFEIIPKVW